MGKRIVVVATPRYSINFNDFYMFFRRSSHTIEAILFHSDIGRKDWWLRNHFEDPARDRVFDRIDFDAHRFLPWNDVPDLLSQLDRLEFDYVCMGNGSGVEQQAVVRHVGRDRCLFSEYGWLPWHENFYISREGCGYNSEISMLTESDLASRRVDGRSVRRLRRRFDSGSRVRFRDFVYVPLQKDVNDFKFAFTSFANNESFIEFIHETVPRHMVVLVKPHPLYNKQYDFSRFGGRFVNVSSMNLNKAQLYKRMNAMMCINSTSILEAILFGGCVFAYGQDLYLNKRLVHFDVRSRQEFDRRLNQRPRAEIAGAFISLLAERQIHRRRCVKDDLDYVRNHYWNLSLGSVDPRPAGDVLQAKAAGLPSSDVQASLERVR